MGAVWSSETLVSCGNIPPRHNSKDLDFNFNKWKSISESVIMYVNIFFVCRYSSCNYRHIYFTHSWEDYLIVYLFHSAAKVFVLNVNYIFPLSLFPNLMS
jgi:hypothetical protein